MNLTLKQLKQEIQAIKELWPFKIEQITLPNGASGYRLSGLGAMRSITNSLHEFGLFETSVKEVKKSIIFTTSADTLDLVAPEASNIIHHFSLLRTLVSNFYDTLTSVVPPEDVNSVNIKLPHVNDFQELSVVAKDFHTALTQVIYEEEIGGQAKIVSVENGSIWVNVFVGSTVALGVVASLAWAAAVIYKKMQEGKLLEQQVRGLAVQNESITDILNAQKHQTSLLLQAEAEHINSEHFQNNQPETIERIKNSIKLLSDLINRGAEIHPALVAPEHVSNLFPDPKNLIGVASKIKQLPVGQN